MKIEVNGKEKVITTDDLTALSNLLKDVPYKPDIALIIEKEVEYLKGKLKESEDKFCESYELFKNYFELKGALKELKTVKRLIKEWSNE